MGVIKINDTLELHYRKHAVYLMSVEPFTPNPNAKPTKHIFSDAEFNTFIEAFITASNHAWDNITPKESLNMGSDYFEYYSKAYDNNGYLSVYHNGIKTEPPYGSTRELYKFNKPKAQSFLYDLYQSQKG